MTTSIHLTDENKSEALEQVEAALDAGKLVLLPTETVYGIGGRADSDEAREALSALKPTRVAQPFTLHVAGVDQVEPLAWLPVQARRLARAYWPGPLTLVLDVGPNGHPLAFEGTLGFRVVAEPFTNEVLAKVRTPLLLTSANPTGETPPRAFDDAMRFAQGAAAVAVDAGPAEIGQPSSVVRVHRNGEIEVLREGALDRRNLLSRAATVIVFLCSGNTCRSPMAEVIARAMFAEKLGIEPEQLLDHGILIASAGCSTYPGIPASDHAITAVAELGLELGDHRSRPLEPALLARASQVYCMGRSHLQQANALLQALGGPFEDDAIRPELLAGEHDIPDPIGGSLADYRAVRDEIVAGIRRILARR